MTGQDVYEERLSGSGAYPVCYLADRRLPVCLAALWQGWSIPFSRNAGCSLGVIGAAGCDS